MTTTTPGMPEAGKIGPTLPMWALRLGLGLAAAALVVAVTLWSGPATLLFVIMVGAGAMTVVAPESHAASVFLGTAAFLVLLDTSSGVTGWTFLAVSAAHAVHALAALSALSPWDGDVERAALVPSVRRFLLVQIGCQPLVALALILA